MASKWITATKGIRYREHESRKHGKKFDRYYVLQYKRDGKVYNEAVGWGSDGITQAECERILSMLRDNWRMGTGPQTLTEVRQANLDEQAVSKEEKQKVASLTLHGVFSDGYLAHQKIKGKSSTTINNEQALMNNYIHPFFGETSIYKIGVSKVDAFIAYLNDAISERTKKPLSNQSKKHAISLVSQIFTYAISRIDNNIQSPIRYITKPSNANNARERFLTKDEARELLTALAERSKNTHDMALLSLFCGLRAGEILSLAWGCVNFEEKCLFLKDTKNGENRHAYMTPEVEAMLQERYANQALDELVFGNAEISKSFERTVKDLGLNDGRTDRRDKVVFHTLRHTFASWHAKAGTPLYTIGKLLGHKTLAMTQRYAHLCPSAEKQAVMALHGALDEPKRANVIEMERRHA